LAAGWLERKSCAGGSDFEFAVTASWNIGALQNGLTASDRHLAVIAFGVMGWTPPDGIYVPR
jgi:hypothetical protein